MGAVRGGEAEGEITEDEFLTFFDSADMRVKEIKEEVKEEVKEEAKEEAKVEDEGEQSAKDEADQSMETMDEETKTEEEKKTEEAKAEEKKAEETKAEETKDDEEDEVTPVCLSKEELSRVFNLLKDETDGISKECFVRLVRTYMRVVKDTALTTGFEILDSKTVRKLDRGEVLEVLEKAKVEPSVKVKRLRARAGKDKIEGWVTVEGNQGTAFLKECGNTYKVVKPVEITDSFELEDKDKDKDAEVQKLKPLDIIEVLEWPKKAESSTLTRLKGRVLGDDDITGWVTVQNAAGSSFLVQL